SVLELACRPMPPSSGAPNREPVEIPAMSYAAELRKLSSGQRTSQWLDGLLQQVSNLRLAHLNRRLSRESWLIAVQPISFMSRSSSVCIRPSARSTPACPAAAKG